MLGAKEQVGYDRETYYYMKISERKSFITTLDCSLITKVKGLVMNLPFFPQQGQSSSAEEWKTLLQFPYPKNLVNRVNGIVILGCIIVLYSVLI